MEKKLIKVRVSFDVIMDTNNEDKPDHPGDWNWHDALNMGPAECYDNFKFKDLKVTKKDEKIFAADNY